MKKISSIKYGASAFNFALLLLRVGAGILLLAHGYDKLVHFENFRSQFLNFMGLGSRVSLSLTIFAEFFCSIFVILGLFTRLAVIPIIVVMCVATFMVFQGHVFGKGELPALYLLVFLTILLVGPGRVSVDGAISK